MISGLNCHTWLKLSPALMLIWQTAAAAPRPASRLSSPDPDAVEPTLAGDSTKPPPPLESSPAEPASSPTPAPDPGQPVPEPGALTPSPEPSPSAPVAASVEVSGLLREKGTGDPVVGATLAVQDREENGETDAQGHFSLRLPPGTWQLIIAMPGFKPARRSVVLEKEQLLLPTIYLEPREDRAPAMVVETRRVPKEMSLQVLEAKEIERIPGTFGDPVRAVESLPNVSRPRFLDGAIVVRGAEPANTAVLLDGHPVPFLFHFGFWKSVINPYFVDSLRFYPGGMPSSYGNVLQAVLDVKSRDIPADRVHGVADINLTDTSLTLTAPLEGGKVRVGAAGRFSYLSLMILGGSAIFGADAYVFPRYSDYQVRLDSRVFGGDLSVTFFGAKDAITLGEDAASSFASQEDRFEAYGLDPTVPLLSRFDHLGVRWSRNLGPDLSLETSTLLGLDQQVSILPLNEDLMRLPSLTRLTRPVVSQRSSLTWKARPELTALFGLEARYTRAALLDLSELFSDDSVPVPDPEIKPVFLGALWARGEWSPLPRWLLIPEVRGTLYAYNARLEPRLEPRATVRWQARGDLALKGALGLYSQIPEEREYSQKGNPDLQMMKAVQGALGLEAELPWQVTLESTVFASPMWDLTLRKIDLVYQQTEWGLSYQSKEVFYSGNGWGYGGEVTLKRPLSADFSGSISYAYTRSLRQNEDGYIPGDYDQPHTLTVLGAWHLKKRWVASGRFRLGSGQPYTPVYGAWSAPDGYYWPLPGATNSARHPLYHQLDLRLDRTVLHDTWKLNFYLDVQNVYLAKNPVLELPNWNYTGAGSTISIPIVPTLGVKGEF